MEKQKTEELLETESYSHKIKQAALSSRLKKSNEALRDTLKQLENNSTAKEPPRHAKDYHSFMETPICRHILETVHNQGFKSKMDCVVYKEHALQKEQLLALRVAADEKMDDFTVRIKKHFPCLTDDDVRDCVARGICKVNFATELRAAYTKAVRELLANDEKAFDPKAYGKAGIAAVKALVMERMKVCGCDGKA